MNLGDEAHKVGRQTCNSSHQIYHRRRKWTMELIAAVGTKLKQLWALENLKYKDLWEQGPDPSFL